ncbi:hypothetical protein [Vulcanococcus limneticus]|uniref:hypothetical protein n=1 Tax=Vulcanococcus limneticus TaxID=2170428 RepID=UPI00398BF592
MSRPEPSTNLPAPYRSPWRALAEDLRAVAASLRLGLQELWRRNGQGDLPRPGPWPRDLAPLFWPLLLALALAALLLVGVGLGRRLGGPAVGPGEPASPAPPAEMPLEMPQERPGTSPAAGPASAAPEPRSGTVAMEPPAAASPTNAVAAPATSAADASDAPIGTSRSEARTTPETDPSLAEAAPTAAATPEAAALPGSMVPPDPLADLLASPAAAGLLSSASAEPASASLQLVLGDGFQGLSGAEQQRRADTWQQLALGLGYEHLQLRAADGALLGREAVVGGGMILLSPPERN